MQGSVSLAAYAGQTIALKFRATTDSSVTRSFYIDNVGFTASLMEEADPHASQGGIKPQPQPRSPGKIEEK